MQELCNGTIHDAFISGMNNDDSDTEVEIYEGQRNESGEPHGRGTLYFDKEKSERFEGHFNCGKKQGKGSFYFSDASILSGYFKDDTLQGKGLYIYDDGSIMVGKYLNGDLNGMAEEYDSSGSLTFKGKYISNKRFGVCHFYEKYGGHIFGVVDGNGNLSGSNVIYAYPDNKTFLKGSFKDGIMVTSTVAVYDSIGNIDNPHSFQKVRGGELFFRDISTDIVISNNPMLEDPFEARRVTVKKSLISDAEEGLFSLIKADPGEVMAFYNGIRITHDEVDGRDWSLNNNTISLDEKTVIDVPKQWSCTSKYKASLGHKANHSFEPNCMYDKFNHPRFGNIKCIRTINYVLPGDELTVAYGYDHEKLETDAPEWYKIKLKK